MSPLESEICKNANPELTVKKLAEIVGCERTAIYRCIERYGIRLKQRKKSGPRDSLKNRILCLADGVRTSACIASELGCSEKHVQNILRTHNAPRMPSGARQGSANPSYNGGRTIDLDGYALVRAPDYHPYARTTGYILEHRYLMENAIGRYLKKNEVVDHIDGLHLHNSPSNLRLFASNADHLKATISGNRPKWSEEGWDRMTSSFDQRANSKRVDTYHQRKARGDVRLQQILLAWSRFEPGSPYLLGTRRHLVEAGIDPDSETMIEQALGRLNL